MRKIVFTALLILPAVGWASPNTADYPIAVHVNSSRLIEACHATLSGPYCDYIQRLSATIDGKKYELEYPQKAADLLRVGDYMARIIEGKSDHPFEFHREYEFLFQDGTKRKFLVVSEED